jgi:mRNA interferase RelE/StbE
MYQVQIDRASVKFIKNQVPKIKRQLFNKIKSLEANPRPDNIEPIKGAKGLFRIRSGNYRIVYKILDEKLLVLVVRVNDRKDVYKRLP